MPPVRRQRMSSTIIPVSTHRRSQRDPRQGALWPDGSTPRTDRDRDQRALPGGAAFVRSTETTRSRAMSSMQHCRSANDFFRDRGRRRLHIDRWIRFAKGEWESTLAIAQAGAPAATPAHQISISAASGYRPGREAASPMRRLRINHGHRANFRSRGGPGRPVLFRDLEDRVEQFSVDAGATGTTVVDSATPIDLTTLYTLTPLDTSTHGRIYYALTSKPSRHSISSSSTRTTTARWTG